MRKNVGILLTLLLAAGALVAAAILLIDYVKPAPVFCDADGGCGVVRKTLLGHPFGVPLPAIGLAGLLAIALAALIPGKRARIAQVVFASIGAVVGVGLLAVQGMIGVLCPYCAVVDTSVVLLCVLSILRLKKAWDPPPGLGFIGGAAGALLLAIGLPIGIGALRTPKIVIPSVIRAEIDKTPRGVVTIVDFVDFECPFCRMTHGELTAALQSHGGDVRLVRKHVPLRMHPHALDAAKAGCCAEKMGKGEEMADALFKTPAEKLTPEGCENLARDHGLDVDAFRACVKDPATQSRIDADRQAFKDSKGEGLPTIWMNTTKLEGAQDRSTLRTTLEQSLRSL